MQVHWSPSQAREVYGIDHWGEGYFEIGPEGHVRVCALRGQSQGAVKLTDIAQAVRREGLALPVLVRFTDILKDRVARLSEAFTTACIEHQYLGAYTPVYPIKVNQERGVVDALLKNPHAAIGLEAGSKSELLAILALSDAGTVICNGYKDRSYIRLALIGRTLGLKVYIVIEKLSELNLVLSEAENLGIEPQLGVRVRLSSISAGKWQNSGGEKSKFGLHNGEILRLIERLEKADKRHWLKLMHFHMGSQIADIGDIKRALREAARYYQALREMKVEVSIVDVGGGLGIDYEGTRSTSDCSLNYSLDEYAQSIVRAFSEVCEDHALPHPDLITESGRALSAHHAVLITNITDIESVQDDPAPTPNEGSKPLEDLADCLKRLDEEPVVGIYHDAQFDLAEARALFVQGALSLAELAEAERLNAAIAHGVFRRLDSRLRSHRDLLDELNERLADKVFCNFSLFQSMPDAWAIGQVFPVMPLQRLDEAPERRAILQDLTCDSDGMLERYIDNQSLESTLRMHRVAAGESYLLGFFLVGAYQEILGDMHNLFGDTHAVNVELDGLGGFRMIDPTHGDGADDMLRYVHIDPAELERAYRKKLMDADLSPSSRKQFETELMAGLTAYTYLEE